jgi:ABC-2 type transport system permease protein
MKLRGFYRLVLTQATILRRNTSFWLASIVVAAVSITVFGWLFNPSAARPFDLGLVDEDGGRSAATLRQTFDNVQNVNVISGDRTDELAALKDGERGAVIIVPAGFDAGLPDGKATLEAFYDVSDDPTSTAHVQETVAGVIAVFNEQLGARSAFQVREESVTTKNIRYIDFLIPGMIGMTIMYVNLGVGFLLVTWREQGILRRLGTTPLGPSRLIASQAISFGLLSVIQVAIILGIGHLAFDVSVEGNLGELALTLALGIAAMLAIGYMLGSVLNTPTSVNAVVNLVAFPMLFLGRSYFPLDPPDWLLPVVQAIPLTHLNDALREIVNRGGGGDELWIPWLALAAWAAGGFIASIRLFRWQ